MRWLTFFSLLFFPVSAHGQVVQYCQAASQLAPAVQQCLDLLTQLTIATGGDYVTIPRNTYRQLLDAARELELLKLQLEPMTASLRHSSDILNSPYIQ